MLVPPNDSNNYSLIPNLMSAKPSHIIGLTVMTAYAITANAVSSKDKIEKGLFWMGMGGIIIPAMQKVSLISQRVLLAAAPLVAAHYLGLNAGAFAVGAVSVLSLPSLALSAGAYLFYQGASAALAAGTLNAIGSGAAVAVVGLGIMEFHETVPLGRLEFQMQKRGINCFGLFSKG